VVVPVVVVVVVAAAASGVAVATGVVVVVVVESVCFVQPVKEISATDMHTVATDKNRVFMSSPKRFVVRRSVC
jgi:hypothetical protein